MSHKIVSHEDYDRESKMKVAALAILLVASSVANAFAPTNVAFVRSTTGRSSSLFMVDTSQAIEDAKKASEKYGATSPEARSAWDIVEEMDASNSHSKKIESDENYFPAPTESVVTVDDEADDYHDMAQRVEAAKTSLSALDAAKKATEEFGIDSPEARSAWELVEELAATATHHKATGSG